MALTLRVRSVRSTLSRRTAREGKADGVSRRAAGEGTIQPPAVITQFIILEAESGSYTVFVLEIEVQKEGIVELEW